MKSRSLTTVPHYPSGRVPKEYGGRLRAEADENGVHVIRLALPSVNRRSLAQRMIQFLSYQIGAIIAGWNRDYDVFLTTTAALQMVLPFTFFSVLRRKPSVYSVHDVYPDVGVKSGIFRHRPIIHLIASLENFCLKHAARVRILSESFRPGLLARGVPDSKLSLIYDWIDIDLFKPLPRDNSFAVEHDLKGRFVVLYAGNIGIMQGLGYLLEAAKLLKDTDDVLFVLVGDGSARKALIEKANQLALPNVKFVPYQPFDKMPEILATADICLVSLIKGSGFGALPSKAFTIFSSGRPVLASVDEGSETWNLVKRADAGLCVPPENPSELAKAILSLKQDRNLRERLGHNGRIWAEQNHSTQSAVEQFEKLLLEAVSSKKS